MGHYETGVNVKPRSGFDGAFESSFGHFYWCIFRVMNFQRPLFFPAQYIMELTFTQAAKGVNKEMSVNMEAACQRCDGKGHEPGTKVQHCHFCNGSGMVRVLTPPPVFTLHCVISVFVSRHSNTCVVLPAGDGEHGPVCDALNVPSLWWQRHSHLHPLSLLPWDGSDQAEEECDSSRACRSASLVCFTVNILKIPQGNVFITINEHEKSPSSVLAIGKATTVCYTGHLQLNLHFAQIVICFLPLYCQITSHINVKLFK